MDITIERLTQAYKDKGYKINLLDNKPYNLNIFGIRSNTKIVNEFNDYIGYFYFYMGAGYLNYFSATTDPGSFYLLNFMNSKGTAIMLPQQGIKSYALAGSNHGYKGHGITGYECLRQIEPLYFVRDTNKNLNLDLAGTKELSIIGANIHRASKYKIEKYINKYSAGCQVIQDPNNYEEFMRICNESSVYFGNKFTYTLLTENDL